MGHPRASPRLSRAPLRDAQTDGHTDGSPAKTGKARQGENTWRARFGFCRTQSLRDGSEGGLREKKAVRCPAVLEGSPKDTPSVFLKSQGRLLQPPGPASAQSRKGPSRNVLAPRSSRCLHAWRAQLHVTLAGGVPEWAISCTCACRPLHSPCPQATVGDGPMVICFPPLAVGSVRVGPRLPWPPLCFQG